MAVLPGHVGMPLFGDCSTEFYKDVMHFISKNIKKHKSAIFSARFLNTPTVFVTSHVGVKELLNGNITVHTSYTVLCPLVFRTCLNPFRL